MNLHSIKAMILVRRNSAFLLKEQIDGRNSCTNKRQSTDRSLSRHPCRQIFGSCEGGTHRTGKPDPYTATRPTKTGKTLLDFCSMSWTLFNESDRKLQAIVVSNQSLLTTIKFIARCLHHMLARSCFLIVSGFLRNWPPLTSCNSFFPSIFSIRKSGR